MKHLQDIPWAGFFFIVYCSKHIFFICFVDPRIPLPPPFLSFCISPSKTGNNGDSAASLPTKPKGHRFRGVTKHKRTQRYEAHIWETKKQIYLGGFDSEDLAAKSHDIMAIRCKGLPCDILNFPEEEYAPLLAMIPHLSREDIITALRNYSKLQTARKAVAGTGTGTGNNNTGTGIRSTTLIRLKNAGVHKRTSPPIGTTASTIMKGGGTGGGTTVGVVPRRASTGALLGRRRYVGGGRGKISRTRSRPPSLSSSDDDGEEEEEEEEEEKEEKECGGDGTNNNNDDEDEVYGMKRKSNGSPAALYYNSNQDGHRNKGNDKSRLVSSRASRMLPGKRGHSRLHLPYIRTTTATAGPTTTATAIGSVIPLPHHHPAAAAAAMSGGGGYFLGKVAPHSLQHCHGHVLVGGPFERYHTSPPPYYHHPYYSYHYQHQYQQLYPPPIPADHHQQQQGSLVVPIPPPHHHHHHHQQQQLNITTNGDGDLNVAFDYLLNDPNPNHHHHHHPSLTFNASADSLLYDTTTMTNGTGTTGIKTVEHVSGAVLYQDSPPTTPRAAIIGGGGENGTTGKDRVAYQTPDPMGSGSGGREGGGGGGAPIPAAMPMPVPVPLALCPHPYSYASMVFHNDMQGISSSFGLSTATSIGQLMNDGDVTIGRK